MAAPTNLLTQKVINGAASATLATAVSNYNTAVATFLANAGSAIWNPAFLPTWLAGGCAVAPDAAVANDQYMFWCMYTYSAA